MLRHNFLFAPILVYRTNPAASAAEIGGDALHGQKLEFL
jgi:hypothetical protein